jgi:hypothetical protein
MAPSKTRVFSCQRASNPGQQGGPPGPRTGLTAGQAARERADAGSRRSPSKVSIRVNRSQAKIRASAIHRQGLRGVHSHLRHREDAKRHSRFCMLVKVPGKDTATVVAALSQHVRQLPATLRRSLTWDRWLEMAQHKSFTAALIRPYRTNTPLLPDRCSKTALSGDNWVWPITIPRIAITSSVSS